MYICIVCCVLCIASSSIYNYVNLRAMYSMGHKKVPVFRNTLPCNSNFAFHVHFRSVYTIFRVFIAVSAF